MRTLYKGKNWKILEVGISDEFKQCVLRSSQDYLNTGRNPKYGIVYLQISYPSNNITFCGENILANFRISKQSRLQIDDGPNLNLAPEVPMPANSIIEDLKKGKVAKIEIDFEGGDPSVHTFSLLGFTKAYNMLPACAGTPAAPTKVVPLTKVSPLKSTSSLDNKSLVHSGSACPISGKQVLDARLKYKIEVLSFDTMKSYGSEFPFSGFVRLRITNSSSVTLPFLTVRTDRYSSGKKVGFSRAPAIPVGDLKPGQSKEFNYYPKGHLDVVVVDRITVQIEKRISKQNKQFFKELD